MITLQRVKEVFALAEDGTLWRRQKNGSLAPIRGCDNGKGHLQVRVDGRITYVHRIVFALHHDRLPVGCVDHADGNPANNKPANLREATKSQNGANSRYSRSIHGFRGVSFDARKKKWKAAISADGSRVYVGIYKTFREAAEAVVLSSLELHGEFSPFRTERT